MDYVFSARNRHALWVVAVTVALLLPDLARARATHPRKMVVNAFMRRGGTVIATQGSKRIYYGGFPRRESYVDVQALGFANQVEAYD